MKIVYSTLLFFFFIYLDVHAQQKYLGSWNILNLKYKVNEKWSVMAETQLRSLKFYDHFHYYEAKALANYNVNKNLKLTLGAGTYQTYKEGGNFVLPKNNNEFRIWPQCILNQNIGVFTIEQRYRAEFRYTSNGYKNRFRYRFGLIYPFGKKEGKNIKPFQFGVSNELFFTDNEPYFERNRLLFNLNYKLTKTVLFQIGFMHQFDYKINDETGRDVFLIGFYYEIIKKNDTKENDKLEINDN